MDRLGSYLAETGGDLKTAIALYDWNVLAGGAIHEDLGRLEVIFRNTVSDALSRYVAARGWSGAWYEQDRLFAGRQNQRTRNVISDARDRARGYKKKRPEAYGKVIAELNFGFWRYLCHKRHLTSLRVTAIAAVFALHLQRSERGSNL